METAFLSSPSVSDRHEGSTYDELSMQQSIMFSDCLKVSLYPFCFIFYIKITHYIIFQTKLSSLLPIFRFFF